MPVRRAAVVDSGSRIAPAPAPAESGWSDARLIDACLGGSQASWSALVRRYQAFIFSIPFRYHASREDAEDIFQAVCLELYASLARLRNTETLRPWLATVTAHACYDWKKRHAPRTAAQVDVEAVDPASPAELPPELLAQAEREQQVRDALGTLTPRCRELMQLLFYEQPPIPYKEIAARVGLAVGSLGFTRGRCLTALKKALDRAGRA
jgi:RNA polymerase sigma factor (sigma-70 family)